MNILITGSTDGIGKLVAIKLAKAGHEVYLHGRNPQKLATAIAIYSSGKTILITGSAGKIGRATTRYFAENGASAVLLDLI